MLTDSRTILKGKINKNINITDIANTGTLSNFGYIIVLTIINETIILNIRAI